MVLGLRTKTRRSPSVQLDYIIHIQEIKPWPPSQSLRTLRAVLIQWEYGEKTSGFTNQVVPSLGTGSGVGDGRIEFNESFRLPVTLMREMSIRGGDGDTFQKNCIEFNLYEPRRDKTVKGQLLGTAVLDFADYGIVKESLSLSAPISCKRTYRNTAQPLLFLKIQSVERIRTSSSSKDSLIREVSMDSNHGESVSALMSEEYAEEAEFTTDDDGSSQSSLAVASLTADSNGSSSPHKESEPAVNHSAPDAKVDSVQDQFIAKPHEEQATKSYLNPAGISSRSSSMDLSSDIEWISKKITSQSLQSSQLEETDKQQKSNNKSNEFGKQAEGTQQNVVNGGRDWKVQLSSEEGKLSPPISKKTMAELHHHTDKHIDSGFSYLVDDKNASSVGAEDLLVAGRTNAPLNNSTDDETTEKHEKYSEARRIMEDENQKVEEEPSGDLSQVDVPKQVMLENGLLSSTKESFAVHSSYSNTDKSKHLRSVRSSLDSTRSNGSIRSNHFSVTDTARGSISGERKDSNGFVKETRNPLSDNRIQQLEQKIKRLEGELMEAAALEVSLYSVVAEHGSSMTKVHAPARRLSRLYFHANKQNSKSGRGTAAKSIVSGLVLVAKACGNDVPRLTFWLSNSIVLRAIVNKSFGDSQLPISVGPDARKMSDKNGKKKSSPLKWESFPSKSTRGTIEDSVGEWENPPIFGAALEKVEAWIFSRIIESLWWQTFTPHMQSGAAKAIRRNIDSDSGQSYRRTSSSIDQQGNFSLELWKMAFRDACERICPVRAAGHDCGCLHVLSKLIMEQLIARLDVAMFNAILRESADEIPTDPIADPISDAEVLPIPAGKASFGAGAQLKNAIGNWSRWLTDLFGIDDGDDGFLENENSSETSDDDERSSRDTSSKSFHLLNALSDLMMLPKDMLLSRTIRKEVCPTFGPTLLRRILNSFIPDEFCPDPIPGVVLEALNSEDSFDSDEDPTVNFPCAAAAIVYQTPSADWVANIFGEIGSHPKLTRSGSSVLKKSQTSDDELDELDSPLKPIILDSFQSSPSPVRPAWASKENGSRNTMRYQLLREVWMNSE
ncbi:hypothetical protein Sango_1759400 [Sesamum angolense]|uniref:C2 NT-type domain-containing protein n=1 Tax=Sesamum angolense TaxID=2727404 RepID=A0AAE2BPB9_9LAMI|nr:hypothetical protein Sango_1759400 [Sesamum angolense]